MIRTKHIILVFLITVLMNSALMAEQPASQDIRQVIPSNSVLVAGFDGRPENPSMQAFLKAESPQDRDLRIQQQAALRKAIENFAVLFGVSLDFAKDIQSWEDQQWAFVIVQNGKKLTPVYIAASRDAAAANAALQKMLEPWQRLGELAQESDSGYSISSFKAKDLGVNVFAAASGPVVAFSIDKNVLKQALQGQGFAAGSTGDKAFKALSGSMFYAYADPALLQEMGCEPEAVPLSGLGLGVSVVDTGVKLRAIGYFNEQGQAIAKQLQILAPAGGLPVNPAIPDPSIAAAALPNMGSVAGFFNLLKLGRDPIFDTIATLGDTQISAAVTAVLPMPGGVASIMTASDQAAAEKIVKITANLKKLGIRTMAPRVLSGIQTTPLAISEIVTLYIAQVGQYVLVASDGQSLASAVATIKGERPGIAQSETYKETIAGLDNSNMMTMYVNLAPIQGLGYLLEGSGLAHMDPAYCSIAKSLENVQAMGVGIGLESDLASATVFLRAKPGIGPSIGPTVVAATAVGAAVMFPVFERAREQARISNCQYMLKQLSGAARCYAEDHGGKLPTMNNWRSQLKPYLPSGFALECPSGNAIFAFNKNLGGLKLENIKNPSEVVMFFEAYPDLPNATGSRADAVLPHNGCGAFAYVDSHVQLLSEVPSQYHWVPKYSVPKATKKAPAKKAVTPKRK